MTTIALCRKIAMPDENEIKTALKQALKEWLDAKWAELGIWSFKLMVGMMFALIIYIIIVNNGFRKFIGLS